MLRLYLYARVRVLMRKLHTGPRVQRAPGLPCALSYSRGQQLEQTSGSSCRENAYAYSVVIVREGGRSSIPETAVTEPRSRGVLDTPPSRGMTPLRGARSGRSGHGGDANEHPGRKPPVLRKPWAKENNRASQCVYSKCK